MYVREYTVKRHKCKICELNANNHFHNHPNEMPTTDSFYTTILLYFRMFTKCWGRFVAAQFCSQKSQMFYLQSAKATTRPRRVPLASSVDNGYGAGPRTPAHLRY
jgi:hypothetical protein